MRAAHLFALLAVSSCIVSCNKSSETEAIPVTTAVTPTPLPSTTAATPTTPVATPPPVVPPKATPPATPVDAGKPADAGTPVTDAGTPVTDAGTPSAKLAACAQKCQGVLASCATPTFPTDGGLPQVKDPKACQDAFNGCVAACTP